jgi:hypothetical protein
MRRPLLDRLVRALRAALGGFVGSIEATSRPWASVTFTGARHTLRLTAEADGVDEAALAALPEHQFALPGHIVADVAINDRRAEGGPLEIEVLTIEEA